VEVWIVANGIVGPQLVLLAVGAVDEAVADDDDDAADEVIAVAGVVVDVVGDGVEAASADDVDDATPADDAEASAATAVAITGAECGASSDFAPSDGRGVSSAADSQSVPAGAASAMAVRMILTSMNGLPRSRCSSPACFSALNSAAP
jgi:hypothetical protein